MKKRTTTKKNPFAINLTILRLRLDVGQQTLADYLGVTFLCISNYERGVTIPRVPMLEKIILFARERGINITYDELIGLDKSEPPNLRQYEGL